MEQEKRKRGRPKIDAGIADPLDIGRRESVNTKFMYDGVGLLMDAASDSHHFLCTGKNHY